MRQETELTNWRFRIPDIGFEREVTLPHTWNVEENKEAQLYRGEAEYETKVRLAETEGKRVRLYFGAAYHTANVFVNDRLAGFHTGCGTTPFEVDITDCVREGENTVRVTVDNAPKQEMLPHKLDYDWADDGGLIRKVLLTVCDADGLLDLWVSYAIEKLTEGTCSGTLSVRLSAVPQRVRVELSECATGERTLLGEAVAEGTLTFPFSGVKLWDLGQPNLYEVIVTSEQDELRRRTGFRTVEVKGAQVLINGRAVYLAGCEWMPGAHPEYGMAEPLSHSVMRLNQLKEMGCVFTRFHWQQDTSLFDWCDENGLLVQEEIPYWGYPKKATPLQLAVAKRQAEEMVRYHAHHPSIICWGVGNELGGEFPTTIDYVKRMYAYFKQLDPSRLVNYVSNSVCRDTNVELDDATMYGDIAMWNEYLGLWQPCDDVEGVIRRTYEKFGEMPSLVSEFGLCEPAFSGGDERRLAILKERLPIYRKLPRMVGYVWFSLNDYRTQCGEYGEGRLKQRIHGSTDLYGNEKPSYRSFAELRRKEAKGQQ